MSRRRKKKKTEEVVDTSIVLPPKEPVKPVVVEEPVLEPVKPKRISLPVAPDLEKYFPYATLYNAEKVEAYRRAWKLWKQKYLEAGGSVG